MSRGGGGRCCPSGGGGERERARLLPPSSSRSSSCRRLRLLRLLLLLLLPTPWVGGAAGSTETSFVAARAAGVALGVAVAILRPEAIASEELSEAFPNAHVFVHAHLHRNLNNMDSQECLFFDYNRASF